jgi:hypothetical protein
MSTLGARKALFTGRFPPPSLDLNFCAGFLDPRITLTRAAGAATYFDATGTLQNAGTNVPRFDNDPATLAPRGLLIEEARTNLLLNSATLGTQTVTVAAAPNTLSFYGTGTVTLSGVSTAGPLVGTGASDHVSLTFTPTAGSLVCTVTGSVSNAQLELGAFPTSYIPTAGATATRAADIASLPWVYTTPGSICVEAYIAGGVTNGRVIGQTTAQLAPLIYQGGTTVLQMWDGNTVLATPNGVVPGSVNKMASTWGMGAGTISLNGRITSGLQPVGYAALNTMALFQDNLPAAERVSGWLSRVRYWTQALSPQQAQRVTA